MVCESDDDFEDAIGVELVMEELPRDGQRESELRDKALRAAEAEGLTLRTHDGRRNPERRGSFVGVREWPKGSSRVGRVVRSVDHRFYARRRAPGKEEVIYLGSFVTAEEAALAYARSVAADPPAPSGSTYHGTDMTAEEAVATAAEEGIELIPAAGSKSGFRGVSLVDDKARKHPFSVAISRNGILDHIGRFATAEEAALEYARAIGPTEAAKALERARLPRTSGSSIFHPGFVAPSVETREEVLRRAEALGLTLYRSPTNATGYKGVSKQRKNLAWRCTGNPTKQTRGGEYRRGWD